MLRELYQEFEQQFGNGGEIRTYFAPGRVNLIGEHTDYNGGHVFPCALTYGTYVLARKRRDQRYRLYSQNLSKEGVKSGSLLELAPGKEKDWMAYPLGVIWAMQQEGVIFDKGVDVLIYGTIPSGAGLSSSASLEVAVGYMLKDLFSLESLTRIDLAKIGQRAENIYVGTNCGIMDQFASAMGKKDCAIFLDTNSLEYEYCKIPLDRAKIIITNSKVKHSLVSSAYNDRRRECEEALNQLQAYLPIKTLGDLKGEEFEQYQDKISSPVNRRRAKHAVYENLRTKEALEALTRKDLVAFGGLMNASHNSLRDDYQVSCKEIDCLVELARQVPGVFGSRITGGGFGGCTVSLVSTSQIEYFKKTLREGYYKKNGHYPEFYEGEIGQGVHRLE